jgi:hypothetical protein
LRVHPSLITPRGAFLAEGRPAGHGREGRETHHALQRDKNLLNAQLGLLFGFQRTGARTETFPSTVMQTKPWRSHRPGFSFLETTLSVLPERKNPSALSLYRLKQTLSRGKIFTGGGLITTLFMRWFSGAFAGYPPPVRNLFFCRKRGDCHGPQSTSLAMT